MNLPSSDAATRAAYRRKQMVGHRASSHADAERWDLEFWQAQTPADRLSAFVAIRKDVEQVKRARRSQLKQKKKRGAGRS